ncbi:MAG: type II toxin-antitoxin system VapC family toxin, partial [Mesorhizobium sp.]|nr:type II toxin-antitoxin system VapC family toxin [Mesorhizobium sp.]
WMNRQTRSSVWTTAITLMEIHFGIGLVPEGRRRERMLVDFRQLATVVLQNRVLPFDAAAAEIAGRLVSRRVRNGINIETKDTQIAAIALSRNATLATRNTRHFQDTQLTLVDPWNG